ncbi:MAG: trypsin-like peptidase domain-containing protein [Nitrososphaerota archaeon]
MEKASLALSIVSLTLAVLLVFQFIDTQQQIASLSSQLANANRVVEELRKSLQDLKTTTISLENTWRTKINITTVEWNITSIYEEAKESVVEIKTIYRFGESIGSGFIYDTQGHVVTNNHVVEGGVEFYVYFLDGSAYRATLVGRDPDTDLAVLKIILPEGAGISAKPLRLGNSTELRIGEQILAIGNPFQLTGSVTTGIVSQKGRLLPSNRGYLIPGIIQIDAAVNPGNSGGPILNMKGEVVGVATAIESTTGGFSGIGYAISSNVVKRIVPVLIEKGAYTHSYLGISGTEINSLVAQELGLSTKKGLLVQNVVAGGPAERAGIRGGNRNIEVAGVVYRVGGDIIIAIDGNPVASMDDLLTYMVERTNPGQKVVLSVLRGGDVINVEVTLSSRP